VATSIRKKLALTSLTSSDRSAGIVRLRTEATELVTCKTEFCWEERGCSLQLGRRVRDLIEGSPRISAAGDSVTSSVPNGTQLMRMCGCAGVLRALHVTVRGGN
jgi:hypothetical protein